MALRFEPPTELVNAYLNRPSPGQEASASIQQALQMYAQQKALQQQRQNEALGTYVKAFEAGGPQFAGDIAKRTGLQNPPALPGQTVPSNGATFPVPLAKPGQTIMNGFQMSPEEMQAQQSIPSANPSRSPLISAWNQTRGGQMTPENPVGLQPDLAQQFDQFGNQGKYGERQRQNLFAQAQFAKTMKDIERDPNAPVPAMTREEALKLGSVHPASKIFDEDNRTETRTERLSNQLRQNLTSSEPYKNLNGVRATAANIANAVKNPGAYGDLSILFDYMKGLDPTSVVRESEGERFAATGSFTQRMANTMNRLVTGETVTQDQRDEVLKYVNMRVKTADSIYRNHAAPTLRQAKRMGVDPLEIDPYYDQKVEDLFGGGSSSGAPSGQAKSISSKGEYEALPSGSTYIWNGETRRKK